MGRPPCCPQVILLLREPVQRAYSQYVMEVTRGTLRKNVVRNDFAAAMREELQAGPPKRASSQDILWRGLYDAQAGRRLCRPDPPGAPPADPPTPSVPG